MTHSDYIDNQKTQEEINNLKLQNQKLELEAEQAQLKFKLDTIKSVRELELTTVNTAKIHKELKWYEIGVIVAAVLAIVAVTKLFL